MELLLTGQVQMQCNTEDGLFLKREVCTQNNTSPWEISFGIERVSCHEAIKTSGNGIPLGARRPATKPWHCHELTQWPWATYITSLGFSFLLCKMRPLGKMVSELPFSFNIWICI